MHHHSSQLSDSVSDVCNLSLFNSTGRTGNGRQGAEDGPDTGAQTKLQRENDELRGNSFLGRLGVMLHADTILGSETPGPRGGGQSGQGGTGEG